MQKHVNRPGFRFCNRCDKEFPLNLENFVGDKSRPGGCGYECRACLKVRKKGKDRRKNRWGELTPHQRKLRVERQKRYYHTPGGRPRGLRFAYLKIDRDRGRPNDLTHEFIAELIARPCTYCGDTESLRGVDRVDNSGGHTMNNVVPCCRDCNVARMDNFTHDEMKILGQTIARIKAARRSKAA
jgi:hypothetical protein